MDYYIFQQINSLAERYLWLDTLAIFFASYFQYVLGVGLVLLMLAKKDKAARVRNLKITALAFLAALISRFVFCQILKVLIARPRPSVFHQVTQLIIPDSYGSFPSGHMAFFFALSTVIYFYIKKVYPERSRRASYVLYAISFLMGLARIFVGIHYPTDILGGMVLGILVGWGSWKILKKQLSPRVKEEI